MQVVQHLEQQLDSALNLYVASTSQTMCNYLVPIAVTGTTIYYITLAFAMARGDVSEPGSKLTKDFLTMTLIAAVALSVGNYQTFVVDGLKALLADLVSAVSVRDPNGPAISSVGQAIDFIFSGCITPPGQSECMSYSSALWYLAFKYRVGGIFPDLSWLWASFLTGMAENVMIVCCMLPYLLAKMAFSVFLALGPVFVLSLMWPSTRKYFDGWFSAILGNVMALVVITAVCSVVPTIYRQYVLDAFNGITADGVDVVGRIDILLVVSLGMGFVALHASQKGAALAGGGVAMDSKGIGGMVTQALMNKLVLGSGASAGKGGSEGGPTKEGGNEVTPGVPLANAQRAARVRQRASLRGRCPTSWARCPRRTTSPNSHFLGETP